MRLFPKVSDCQVGHTSHHDRLVSVNLDGPADRLPNSPPVPARLAQKFDMVVYREDLYPATPGYYCPGRDEVSKSIILQGRWEGYETVLALDVLTGSTGMVYDFGAQLGWYTILAARTGHHVVAIEPDPENLRLLNLNLRMLGLTAEVRQIWVEENTPTLTPGPPVRLVKIDVEGHCREAVQTCLPLLDRGDVDYLLVEVSPVFVDDSAETVARIVDRGYAPFLVPNEQPVTFGADPLGKIRDYPLRNLDWPQRDVLFIRNDLL